MVNIFWNERIRLIDSGRNVDVLAIGDSWFHYPFNNLITPLYEALERPTIYVIGENGARADKLAEGAWRDRFRQMLIDYPTIRLVCISAGGNDFAGLGDLDETILKPDCRDEASADACFRSGQPDDVFAAVGAAYRTLLRDVFDLRAGVPVLVHNYDCAIPDGRTLPGLRSWLKLPMDNCRVSTQDAPLAGIRREIVKSLIDHFTLALDALASAPPEEMLPPVKLIWSAGTLSDSAWANELHPRPSGFARLVEDCWSGPARSALGLP